MLAKKKKTTSKQTQIRKANVENVAEMAKEQRERKREKGSKIGSKVRAELPFGLHKFHYPKRREAATILN